VAYSEEALKVIFDSCARIYATAVEKELMEEDRIRTLQANQEIGAEAL